MWVSTALYNACIYIYICINKYHIFSHIYYTIYIYTQLHIYVYTITYLFIYIDFVCIHTRTYILIYWFQGLSFTVEKYIPR